MTALLAAAFFRPALRSAEAQGFSRTEFQYQGGTAFGGTVVSPPGFQHVFTLQHASAWSRGENFFFVDMVCCSDPVSNRDMYLEWYSALKLSAVTNREFSWGPVADIGLLGGINWGAQTHASRLTPGLRFSLDLPGFAFANLDATWLVDVGRGLDDGGPPRDGGILGLDFNWARPFSIGDADFSVEGHGEWQSPHTDEAGVSRPYTVLLQPQVRWNLSKAVADAPDRVLLGVEFQLWLNKFGVPEAHEFLPQLLVVFGF